MIFAPFELLMLKQLLVTVSMWRVQIQLWQQRAHKVHESLGRAPAV